MSIVFEAAFPGNASPEDQLRFLIHYAILAPSGHNTQPWLFRFSGDGVELVADRTRALPVVDPHDRELTISCGAAHDHCRVAAKKLGYELFIDICPYAADIDVLARVKLGSRVDSTELDDDLFSAIAKRRTNRSQFEDRPLPAALLSHCETVGANLGVDVVIISERTDRSTVAELVAAGDRT